MVKVERLSGRSGEVRDFVGGLLDRLMSNAGVDVWDSFARWVPQQVGAWATSWRYSP